MHFDNVQSGRGVYPKWSRSMLAACRSKMWLISRVGYIVFTIRAVVVLIPPLVPQYVAIVVEPGSRRPSVFR